MILSTISHEIIVKYDQKFGISDRKCIILILIDGVSLCGYMGGLSQHKNMISENDVEYEYYLKLFYSVDDGDLVVFVPLNYIAGISLISYEQFSKIIVSKVPYFDEYVLQDLLIKNDSYGFPVTRSEKRDIVPTTTAFVRSEIRFRENTPLYSDWAYLQRTSGGWNNLGLSTPIAGVSAGWEKSLWSLFNKRTTRILSGYDEACTKSELTITGFVSIFERQPSPGGPRVVHEEIEMEGVPWIAAAVCSLKAESIDDLRSNPWLLLYLRRDGFMFPMQLWKDIEQPINIFAEVIPVATITEAGEQPCFLKARAIAFVM